jgi:hypothetical protein
MARYMQRYVGTYRVLADYDKTKNDFPRVMGGCNEGNLDPSFDDLYIVCASGAKIYHYGGNKLQAYIPSIGKGHNIIKAIYNEVIGNIEPLGNNYKLIYKQLMDNGLIFDIEETDMEILFKFKANNIETIAKYMKPKTSGVSISPFSNKNLTRQKYHIPLEDLALYKEITASIPQDDLHIYIDINNGFLGKLATKKHRDIDEIKKEIKTKGLKQKEYFHSLGKDIWNDYIKFIKEFLNKEM